MSLLSLKDKDDKKETPKKKSTKTTLSIKDVSTSSKSKPKQPKKKIGNSKIMAFIGKQGTGKTYNAAGIAKYGKVLYLDGEKKAHTVINEHFKDYDIKIKVFRVTDAKHRIDKLATVQKFMKKTPKWIKLIESGEYAAVVIENCSIFRPYAKHKWLSKNPKRTKPQPFEWGDIEEIVQDMLYPFINCCRDYNVHLILNYGIKEHYIKDVMVGTVEDAKQWLLGELDIELWLEWDYKMYCIKHHYKPFWEYRNEGENIFDFIFDREFIDESVTFKDYQQFKEETLISNETQRALKAARDEGKLLTIK